MWVHLSIFFLPHLWIWIWTSCGRETWTTMKMHVRKRWRLVQENPPPLLPQHGWWEGWYWELGFGCREWGVTHGWVSSSSSRILSALIPPPSRSFRPLPPFPWSPNPSSDSSPIHSTSAATTVFLTSLLVVLLLFPPLQVPTDPIHSLFLRNFDSDLPPPPFFQIPISFL